MRRLLSILCIELLLAGPLIGATRTSTASGNWSAGATWVGGVAPVDGDDMVIADTHNVTLDVDMSGYATGIGLTINLGGILTVAGGTSIKMKNNIDLMYNGLLTDGSTDSVLTIPESAGTFIIFLRGGGDVTGPGVLNLRAQWPTIPWTTGTNAESTGSKRIEVDNDLTADNVWDVGDEIAIIDVAGTLPDMEIFTIEGITSTYIDLPAGGAGLAAAKAKGSIVALLTRNVRIHGDKGTNSWGLAGETNTVTALVEIKQTSSGVSSLTNANLKMTTNDVSFFSALRIRNCHISDSILLPAVAGSYALSACSGIEIRNSLITGQLASLASPFTQSDGVIYQGVRFAGSAAAHSGSVASFVDCSFNGNTQTFYRVPFSECFNCTFADAAENTNYNSTYTAPWARMVSFDHNGIAGAYKYWSRGGITLSQTANPPAGFKTWYQLTCESAVRAGYDDVRAIVMPGETIRVRGVVRIDADFTGPNAEAPALQIINQFADPLVNAANSPLASMSIPVADGTVITWQRVEASYENKTKLPISIFIRITGRHATENVDFAYQIMNRRVASPESYRR